MREEKRGGGSELGSDLDLDTDPDPMKKYGSGKMLQILRFRIPNTVLTIFTLRELFKYLFIVQQPIQI